MAVKEILQIGHPVLATPALAVPVEEIASEQIQSGIDDMIDTMRDANGAGIAANQIGLPWRIFVIEIGDNPRYPYKPRVPLTVVINPQIEFLSELKFTSNEGCLSVPQMRANVERYVQIRVKYLDRQAKPHEEVIEGYSACTWQHEYDHLDGILFPHRVTDLNSFTSWQIFQKYFQESYAKHVQNLVLEWGA